MGRTIPLLAVLTLVVTGCGGSAGQAKTELRETADRLGTIHSGSLVLRLVVTPTGDAKGRIGFVLAGPFALRPGRLPLADIEYTQLAGVRSATATFVSTGATAYAIANGKRVSLSPSATEEIRTAASGIAGSEGIGGLRIDTWLKHPSVSDGGRVYDADTDHISADLDVVNAANGLLALVRQLGRDTPTITGKSADQLQDAVKSSSIEVWTGKQDKLLRRLLLKAELGFDVPEELKRALGEVVGAKIEFELAISRPNQPVHITPPAGG